MTSQRGERRRWLPSSAPVLVALLAAVAILLGPAVPPPALAAEDLSLTTVATYTLRPDDGLVRVVVDVTARNTKPDSVATGPSGTVRTEYYYSGASFAVQAEATGIRATSGGTRLPTTTRQRRGYQELTVSFRRDLFFGQSTKLRITFDLPGGRPRSASDTRINPAFAAFYAWAFGDQAGVRVVIPPGFEVQASGDDLNETVDGGRTILAASRVPDPASWYAAVIAERDDGLTQDRLPIPGESVIVRAWPGDSEWRDEVTGVLTRGLPVLAGLVDLPWPVEGDLVVTEVHTPLLEGYAGIYLPATDEIEISEDLDALTILHEASHAWFNGDLFSERWINEGLADTYAALALTRIGVAAGGPEEVSPTGGAAFPLAVWPPPGRVDDPATEARETYGYNASWTVVAALVDDVGLERMRDVLDAAAEGTIPYRGEGDAESIGDGAPDWRRLLDLFEEVGRADEATTTFAEWVVPDDDLGRLDERAAARQRYAALVADGGTWLPPPSVRRPMAAWSFDAALVQVDRAEAILALRDEIARRAAALGLTPPSTFEAAYEGAATDVAAARPVGEAQLAAVADLEEAAGWLAAPRDVVTSVGLWGEDPASTFSEARAAFEADDLERAGERAAAAAAVLDAADEAGRGRLLAGAGAGGATVLVLAGGTWWVIRRRRSATLPPTPPAEPTPPVEPTPPAEPPRTADGDEQGGDTP